MNKKAGNTHKGSMQVTTQKSLTQVIQQAMKQVISLRNIEAETHQTATRKGEQKPRRAEAKTCGQGWQEVINPR